MRHCAARDRRVALIEQRQVLGGDYLHTGTIPSETLWEAVLYVQDTVIDEAFLGAFGFTKYTAIVE